MDIKQAIERVSGLRDHIEQMRDILTMLERRKDDDGDVHVDVWNPDRSKSDHQFNRRALLTRNALMASLLNSIRVHEEEISRLQPVIDMANAALKGVGA
jgi:hypothetical protein